MIHFRMPKLIKMHNGDLCIELTEAGTWESFPAFAEALASQLGARIIERIDGPDTRLWMLTHAGRDLRLVYQDFPNGVSLEPAANTPAEAIQTLFDRFMSEVSENGI